SARAANPFPAGGSAIFRAAILLTGRYEMPIVRHAAERRLLIFLVSGKVKLQTRFPHLFLEDPRHGRCHAAL
ncbi:hypothetical protein ACXWO6_09700, partial [Streptococcus pyogenes]